MEHVTGKRCDHPDGCSKEPAYGFPDGKAFRCAGHKEAGMENLRSKRCPIRSWQFSLNKLLQVCWEPEKHAVLNPLIAVG